MTQTNEKAKTHNKESGVEGQVEEFVDTWVSHTDDDKSLEFAFIHTQEAIGVKQWLEQALLKAEERGRQEILNNLVSECQEVEIPWLTCKKLCEALTQDTVDNYKKE